jgi:hypothetical protein
MTKNSSPILLNLPNLVLIVHFVFCIQKLKRPFHNACIFQQTLKLNIRLVLKNNKKTKKFRIDFHCWWLKMKVWRVLEKKLLLPQSNLEENLPTKWKHKNKCRPIIVTFNGSYLDLQFENVFDVHNFSYLVIDSLVLSMLAEGFNQILHIDNTRFMTYSTLAKQVKQKKKPSTQNYNNIQPIDGINKRVACPTTMYLLICIHYLSYITHLPYLYTRCYLRLKNYVTTRLKVKSRRWFQLHNNLFINIEEFVIWNCNCMPTKQTRKKEEIQALRGKI